MLRPRALGCGGNRLAAELGVSRNTVRRSIEADNWAGRRQHRRSRNLEGREDWLAERFHRHRGHADVVRRDLARELGLHVRL